MSDEIKNALLERKRHYDLALLGINLVLPKVDAHLAGILNEAKADVVALHDSPLGFTQEDVRLLDFFASFEPQSHPDVAKARSLASRIQALLPPEKQKWWSAEEIQAGGPPVSVGGTGTIMSPEPERWYCVNCGEVRNARLEPGLPGDVVCSVCSFVIATKHA